MAARPTRKPTFVGLFSGCGGFDLGFEQAGFRSVAALDIDPEAVATYNANLSGNAEICDLSRLTSLKSSAPADVVIAGPPCQGFSTLGRRAASDPRNSMLIKAAQLAVDAKPKVIILENVSGVVAGAHRSYWNAAHGIIEAAGYKTREFRIVGTSFGLPQIRKRMILLAARCSFDDIAQPLDSSRVALRPFLSNVDGLSNHSPRKLIPGTAEYGIAQRIRPYQKLCNVRGGHRSVPTWEIPEVFGPVTPTERNILCLVRRLRRRRRQRSFGDADPLSIRDLIPFCAVDSVAIVKNLQEKGYLRRIGCRFDLTHTFNGSSGK